MDIGVGGILGRRSLDSERGLVRELSSTRKPLLTEGTSSNLPSSVPADDANEVNVERVLDPKPRPKRFQKGTPTTAGCASERVSGDA